MSKKQFTLDSWLKDKSQKVVTRCGFPVRIVCTDVKRKDYPILALVERDDQEEYQSFTKDGRFSLYNHLHDNFDLFIVTADEVSEDEKVREELIKHLKEGAEGYEPAGGSSDYQRWLAWVEKQGEHANFRNKIQVGDKVTRNEAGVLVNLSQLNRVAKKDEKQGEQKFEMKTAEESLGIDSDTYNKIIDECIFCEQKPTDKVEPKFKVGEKELTDEELREGLIRGMINEHNRVVKEVLRNEYEKGSADVLAKIDAIDVDEMVYESGATSRVTQYWYAHGVNDVIKKLKEEQV